MKDSERTLKIWIKPTIHVLSIKKETASGQKVNAPGETSTPPGTNRPKSGS